MGTCSFGARTYDPSLRRWVSPDPLLASVPSLDEHLGDNLNLYAYAGNNPIRRIDLSGFEGDDSFWKRLENLKDGFMQGSAEASIPGGMVYAAQQPRMGNADADLGRAAGHLNGGLAAISTGGTMLEAGGAMGVGS